MHLKNSSPDSHVRCQSLGQIRLRQEAQLLWVRPLQDQAGQALSPFIMPPFPMRYSDRCASTAQMFYHRTGRCMAFLFLLNVQSQTWGCGIPNQRCAKDACCWDINRKDFADLPQECCLAGSFQSHRKVEPHELPDLAPPHDGIHMILQIGEQGATVWTLLRIGEECQIVRPDRLLFDESQYALDQAVDRLTLV